MNQNPLPPPQKKGKYSSQLCGQLKVSLISVETLYLWMTSNTIHTQNYACRLFQQRPINIRSGNNFDSKIAKGQLMITTLIVCVTLNTIFYFSRTPKQTLLKFYKCILVLKQINENTGCKPSNNIRADRISEAIIS